jgi:hypothetical protein
MDGLPNARSALASERTKDMADMRRCIGSAKFGIEAHEAPVHDFPVQPSQKDGLGRMCKTHWNQYTTALRKAALERKAANAPAAPTPEVADEKPVVGAKKGRASTPKTTKARSAEAVVEGTPDAAPVGEA